uniref:Inter-alpha-trypsin inhibitor heavy chain H3 n=1 Tax=Astatotilapia calliptera TaxID=8154 RepID=A0A3P8QEL3_ASTCA
MRAVVPSLTDLWYRRTPTLYLLKYKSPLFRWTAGLLAPALGSLHRVEVQSIRITCTVSSRFAHTVMSSKALNKENSSQEIFFEVELPKMAFITNFSMEIDGQVYVGEVKEKESAKEQYEKAVSSGKTAGLVKASGRKMEMFSVSVNIAAQSSVSFILIYEELLQRTLGSYEILIRVKVEQPVQEFQIEADIYEPQGIAFVEASATFLTNELIPLIEKTVTDTKAHISFSPTVEQQQKCPGCKGSLINGDFIIKYDVKRATSLGEVQAVNGYFVHFFSPPDLARVPKNVVYVIDTSGSMHGAKIEQTRESMVAILQDLHEEDHFGILLFERKISYWKDYLTKATKRNVSDAIDYHCCFSGTNINSAILDAVSLLKKERKEKKVPERSMDMIFLLTDGMPNSGVTSPQLIQQNVFSAIGGIMSLFCLGFGNDVDYSFLDVMCRQNKGVARRIFEGSDAAIQLKGFYEEVSSPLLLEVDLRYSENTDFLTKTHYSQLFNGSEIVVAGQLKENDVENFSVEVFAHGGKASVADWQTVYPEKGYIFGDFIERMWAYLTIQQQLENRLVHGEIFLLPSKALNLSLKYNFVTPLTSLVVTKPENENGADRSFIADKLTESRRKKIHHLLAAVDGDPHFMIELPDKNDALCFNINDKPGTIFSLVRDPKSGFVVNGQIISKKKVALDGNVNTYFGRFGITHQNLGVRLDVSIQDISVFYNDKQVKLLMELNLVKNCSLTVTLRHSVKFRVIRHTKVWKRRHDHQDYLGFYTLDSQHLSASVHGLLGQFYRGVVFELTDLHPGEGQEKLDATMYVKGQRLNVTRHWQKDFNKDVKNGESIACWFVDNEGRGLIDGTASDYTVSDLFTAI